LKYIFFTEHQMEFL